MNQDTFLQKVLKEAVKVAQAEGLVDQEVIDRVNELKADALLDVPTTELGQSIKDIASKEESVESPYVQPKFDYDELRDKTVNVALRQALAEIGKYDHLVMLMKETPEGRK